MTRAKSQAPIVERINYLEAVISSDRFLQMRGVGNELPFFICPFDPTEAVAMETARRQLIQRLTSRGIGVLEIDLYSLVIEVLQTRGIWERILEVETTVSKADFKELLQGVLDPETHLTPVIAERIRTTQYDTLFLSGVGEIFPYLRSHNILNNLHRIAQERPLVMFFPGDYTSSPETGESLDLFGRLRDDKYYRAFNIYDYTV